MAKLPSLTAVKVIRALKRAGFQEDRQKGSHLVLPHCFRISDDRLGHVLRLFSPNFWEGRNASSR